MSYQVLARKWRPKNFHEMVGQTHVLRALINALDENRLHHAYLFTGTRGVGKTTVARIFAKSLNCDEGIGSNPCGVCPACQEINDGRFVDLIEVDAASRTKVEDTREILENVQYAPTRGRYKVYLIDEVHMLSKSSFNALLKTLEEPPEHVKFLLATTDPQKLPMTVLSRCLQFNLKNMSAEMVVGHLENVLTAEKIEYQSPALWQLAKAANGSMRDAMSLTDQSIAFGQGKVLTQDVNDMLGNVDSSQVQHIVRLLLQVDAKGLLNLIQQISEHAPDYLNLLQEVAAYFHTLAIAQMAPSALNNTMYQNDYLVDLANKTTAEHIQLCYQLALQSTTDLKISPDGKVGFEMAMMRIIAFSDQPISGDLPDLPKSEALESDKHADTMPSTSHNTIPQLNEADASPKQQAHKEDQYLDVSSNKSPEDKSQSTLHTQIEPLQIERDEPSRFVENSTPEIVAELVSKPPTQVHSEFSEVENHDSDGTYESSFAVEDQACIEPLPIALLNEQKSSEEGRVTSEHAQSNTLPFEPDLEKERADVGVSTTTQAQDTLQENEVELTNDVDDQALLDEPLIHTDQWIKAFERLELKGLIGSIFSNAQWIESDKHVNLVICEQHERLFNPSHLETLKQKLNDAGLQPQKPINVEFGQVRQTPYVFQNQRKIIKNKRANIEFAAHEIVQYLKEQFSVSILTETVTPTS